MYKGLTGTLRGHGNGLYFKRIAGGGLTPIIRGK